MSTAAWLFPASRRQPAAALRVNRWLLLLLIIVVPSGCVRRRMTIRSDPPGALVSVDQQEIGITPVSDYFTYYGARNFQLSRDGYESVAVSRNFKAPWYQWPVIEFFTENLWPFEIRDERVVDFQLSPQRPVATEALVRRGQQLREGAQSGIVTPLPPVDAQPTSPSFLPPGGGFAPPPPAIITPPR